MSDMQVTEHVSQFIILAENGKKVHKNLQYFKLICKTLNLTLLTVCVVFMDTKDKIYRKRDINY